MFDVISNYLQYFRFNRKREGTPCRHHKWVVNINRNFGNSIIKIKTKTNNRMYIILYNVPKLVYYVSLSSLSDYLQVKYIIRRIC